MSYLFYQIVFFVRHLLDVALSVAVLAGIIGYFKGYRILFVMSGSMEPTFRIHQPLVAKCITAEDSIEIGDIVSYRPTGNYSVTHRVVGIEDGKYILKGDNNNEADAPIERAKIINKVVRYKENVKIIEKTES